MKSEPTGQATWVGKAFCTVGAGREEFDKGYRGAIFVFACLANDVVTCVQSIDREAQENGLYITGFEYLFDSKFLDRDLSDYEQDLIDQLETYPVQFRDVHFFFPDA